ncbi:MAG: hypothetical protein IJD92_02520 [Bacilli bacterium]|nr:hypothetical protein [Bacilli bacterium]
MNSLEVLTKIYKPYNVIVKGNTTIFKCTSGNYAIKKKCNKDIRELYNYLNSRNFNYYPELIEDNRDEVNVYEYIEDASISDEQKLFDLIDIISLLHNKTSYYKEITNDKIKTIYEDLLGRVSFIEDSLNKLIFEIEDSVFVSPSCSLLLINSSKVFESLVFLKKEIEEWYKLSLDSNKMRVSLLHNNLSLEHYVRNDKEYLISWDNYTIDTPILDIVKLYKKIYLKMDFSEPLKIYMDKFTLTEVEKKLLFIMLVLPDEIVLSNNEVNNVFIVRSYLDYIYKTENLIKSYYNMND